MKGIIASNTSWSIYNFRLSLIDHLDSKGIEISTITSDEEYSNKIPAKNFPFLPNSQSLNLFLIFSSLIRTYFFLKKANFDFLMTFTVRTSIEVAILNIFIRKPLFMTINGLGVLNKGENSSLGYLLRNILRIIIPIAKVEKLFFQSNHDLEFFIENKIIPSSKNTRIVNGTGVDLNFFKPAVISSKKPMKFLHFSRLLKSKGVGLYLDLAKKFHNDRDLEFYLAGNFDENDKDSFDPKLIEKYSTEGIISYLGFINNIKDELKEIDCVIFMSTYPEGIPKNLIEACSLGKIIVTSKQSGCRLTVDDRQNGFSIEPSLEKLEETVKALKNMSEKDLNIMKRKSVKLAHKKFDIEIINIIYSTEISKLIDDSN